VGTARLRAERGRAAARLRRVRELAWVLAQREFQIRYRRSALDRLWSLVTPVVTLAVYGVVLTYGFDVPRGSVPYLSLVWVGLVVWSVFSTAVGSGVYSVVSSAELVSKVYFPREVLPLASVGAAGYDLAIGSAVLVCLVAVQVRSVSVFVVATVPALIILMVWTAAAAIFLGIAAVFARDLIHITRLGLQLGFFATPVMYPTEGLPHWFVVVNRVNPLAVAIETMRDAVLYQRWPLWWVVGAQIAAGLVALGAAVWFTAAAEDRIVDVV
jgi:ABC-type polysaccharide/polyol phosphate export permease